MARKLNKNLLALGSAAIVSIYAVGFARTAVTPASAGSAAASPATVASVTQPPPVDAATAIAQAIASASATPIAASPTAVATSPYKDGTYTGTGTSRMGNIAVAVTMEGGHITAVQITGSTTHYPTSRISQLPGEVVAAQSTNIKLVSGATYSSQAFQQAVTQALAQAATSA